MAGAEDDVDSLEAIVKAKLQDTNGDHSNFGWNKILSVMSGAERKQLLNELLADAKARCNDPKKLAGECMFLMEIFGEKDRITLRDIAAFWGMSHVGVLKTERRAMDKLKKALASKGGKNFRSALDALTRIK